jgi:hypothetical protein
MRKNALTQSPKNSRKKDFFEIYLGTKFFWLQLVWMVLPSTTIQKIFFYET